MAAAVRANAPHKALARSIQKAAGFRALPERRLPGSSSALRTCIATLSLHYTPPPRPVFFETGETGEMKPQEWLAVLVLVALLVAVVHTFM